MDGSIVFARWRQCALRVGILASPGKYDWTCASFGHPSPQPNRQVDWFSGFLQGSLVWQTDRQTGHTLLGRYR